MRPIDFVLFNGDSSPNQPVCQIAEAMEKPIKIFNYQKEFVVYSYYFDDGQMILEVKEINNE
jgi:hypothetical protein